MASRVRVELDEILCHFKELEDSRSTVNRRHPLGSVVGNQETLHQGVMDYIDRQVEYHFPDVEVRLHWGIENSCHWSLDVSYRENESRLRAEVLGENFAWLNRFTLSLLNQHPGTESLVMKRPTVAGTPMIWCE